VSPKGYTPPVSDDAAQALAQILPQTEVVNAIAQRIHELAQAWWPPRVEPPKLRTWLTLDEAAAFSGLPKSWLLKRAETGRWDAAVDVGRRKGGRWRFRRDLL
jgi:hypothetical protein